MTYPIIPEMLYMLEQEIFHRFKTHSLKELPMRVN